MRTSLLPRRPLTLARFENADYIIDVGTSDVHRVAMAKQGARVLGAVDLTRTAGATGLAVWGVVWSEYSGGNGIGDESTWLSVMDLSGPGSRIELKWPLLLGKGGWSKDTDHGSASRRCHLRVVEAPRSEVKLALEDCDAGDVFSVVKANVGSWVIDGGSGWKRNASTGKNAGQ